MKNKLYISILSILNILVSFILIIQVFVFRDLIDKAISKSSITTDIIIVISLITTLLILRFIFLLIRNKYSLKLEVYLKGEIFKNLMKKKFSEISNIHSAELSNIYLTDVKNILEARCYAIPTIASCISRIIFAFIAIINLNYMIIIILMALGLIVFVISVFYGRYVKKLNKKALKADDNLNSYMQESLENIRLLKTLSTDNVLNLNLDQRLKENYIAKNKRNNIQVFASIFLTSLSIVLYALTLCYSAYLIYKGKISYGTLTALVSLVSYFESPITSLASLANKIYSYHASTDRINELYQKADEESQIELNDFDSISIKDLSFSYDNQKVIFNNFNYEINKNDIIYIKGKSGKGKTTLINILLGFYPYSGNITIKSNNESIKLSEKTRNLFSYVPQENIIFSGTIKSNFKMFYPNIKDDEIINSLEMVNLYSEIKDFGGVGYEIFERGRGLSIGQIQRLLVAIALASNKPIIIMDEFTSALDTENENIIVDLITKLNKTIILVSHRTLNIENAKVIDLGGNNEDN